MLLRVHTSPNRQQKTSVKSDTYDPVWNETFKFYLHEKKKNTLGMSRYRPRVSARVTSNRRIQESRWRRNGAKTLGTVLRKTGFWDFDGLTAANAVQVGCF